MRLSKEKQIKPVVGVDFRNGVTQQFILLAKTNDGFEQINTYLSTFLHDHNLEIPARSKFLDDTYVIYPYEKGKEYDLKEHEYLGVSPKDLNHLKFRNGITCEKSW